MLERMDQFFETRLSGYDENMLNSIEGAGEFYKFTAAQLPRGIVATGMSGECRDSEQACLRTCRHGLITCD